MHCAGVNARFLKHRARAHHAGRAAATAGPIPCFVGELGCAVQRLEGVAQVRLAGAHQLNHAVFVRHGHVITITYWRSSELLTA
jgi:hypothetical protein